MDISEALDLLNDRRKYPNERDRLKRNKDIYIAMSLHTLGACPYYAVDGVGEYRPVGYYGIEYHNLFRYKLLTRHPRESETTRNWRFSQYRPMTKAPFGRVTELVTGAIFQDGNYTVEIPNDLDREYIWGNNFHGYNLIGYFANIGYKNMVEDPNGYFVRIPRYKWDEQEDEQPEIDIWFVGSDCVKYCSDEEIIFTKGDYAYHIDTSVIYRYKLVNKKYIVDPDAANGYYAHMFGRLPISIAGGDWNTKGHYDSFYEKARAAADDFIGVYSAKQLVDKEASYPFIIEASEDCPTCQGKMSVQRICDECPGGLELVPCGECGGTGQQASDPAKRKIVPIDKMKDGQLIQIVNPDVSVNEHHSKTVDYLMRMILESLVIEIIDEAQSGTAKAIDQDRLFKFISKISNHLFDDLIYETLVDIIAYRNVVSTPDGVKPSVYQFKLIKPSQFQIKTEQDLLNEMKTSRESNVPKYLLSEQAKMLVDKQYSGDEYLKKKTDVMIAIDRTYMDTVEEMLSKRLAGSISTDDMIFHDQLPLILDEISRDKGVEWFVQADIAVIKVEVDRIFKPVANPLQEQAVNNME